jgi:hypothetical protein
MFATLIGDQESIECGANFVSLLSRLGHEINRLIEGSATEYNTKGTIWI